MMNNNAHREGPMNDREEKSDDREVGVNNDKNEGETTHNAKGMTNDNEGMQIQG